MLSELSISVSEVAGSWVGGTPREFLPGYGA